MFAYIDKDSILHKTNPIIKLVLVAIFTVIVCLSYYPFLPLITFVLVFFATLILGKIPTKVLCRNFLLFFVVSMLFIFSMMILRGFNDEPNIVLTFWILKWSETDVIHAVSLGFRILALVIMSMSFVMTTKPNDLVLSLILQCKLSPVHGYAAMAAYRFLPELQQQVDSIHLAQEIRGIPWNKGIVSRFTSPFRIILPLMCVAARRGDALAGAMESRGMGENVKRTYYKKTEVTKNDWFFFVTSLLVYALIVFVLVYLDLFNFSVAAIS